MIGATPRELPIVRFQSEADARRWYSIDDAVMGGVSESRLSVTPEQTGIFSGNVRAENNGGFASIRTVEERLDLGDFEGFRIRVRGDGKRYKLCVKTEALFDGVVYQCGVQPRQGEWQTLDLPFDRFVPTFRGRVAGGADPLDFRNIVTLGLMISDGQLGPFRLEISSVAAYREGPAAG